MDFNQHMRNAAYLGVAEETRPRYLEDKGWAMSEFTRRRLGPVVVEDVLTYRKELRLLKPFRVELAVPSGPSATRRRPSRSPYLGRSTPWSLYRYPRFRP